MMFIMFAYLLALDCAYAAIFLVPTPEYPTIQSGIDASAPGDTVLVSPGVYSESVAVGIPILLKGDATPDSGDYPRPIIDPSTLSSPRTRGCLFVGGGPATIEDFVFRNGPEMYPRTGAVGGVSNNWIGTQFNRCLFDSTNYGIYSRDFSISIRECEFRHSQRSCVQTSATALYAEGCTFSGLSNSGFALVMCGSNSVIERCHTRDLMGTGDLWWLYGTGVAVEQCIFGPARTNPSPAVWGVDLNSSLFESNIFTNMLVGSSLIGAYNCACDSPVVLRGNQFIDNLARVDMGQGGNNISVDCAEFGACASFVAEYNTFIGGSATIGDKAMRVDWGDTVRYNRFINMMPEHIPVIEGAHAGAECHDNIFYGNGLACSVDSMMGATLDASHNWWGDSSGPYHPTLNPRGLGDAVTNGVTFDPWYRDTSFFQINEADYRAPLPEQFKMLVYPNPFNSVAQIEITPSRAVIIEVELFDLLGRKVRTVWDGPVGVRSRISFNASELSSGVYFVRAWDILGRKSLAMEKIVLLK